jgi:hypothetical protein
VSCLAIATLVYACLAIASPYIVNMLSPDTIAIATAKKPLSVALIPAQAKIAVSFDTTLEVGSLKMIFLYANNCVSYFIVFNCSQQYLILVFLQQLNMMFFPNLFYH